MNGLAMGLYDDLDNQTQPLLNIDVTANNLIVVGGHRSGKTTFIKTVLVRLHELLDDKLERDIYILDFGGNLGQYRDLNCISACFDNSNEENVRRVFRTIESKVEKNSKLLSSRQFLDVFYGGDEVKPAHIMLIIDNVNSFLADERYESYHEVLLKFCRDGLSKGLSIIFTATDLAGGMSRFMNYFGHRFAMAGSADKYVDIFGMKVNEPMHNPGRGMTLIDGKPKEFQIFLPFRCEDRDLPKFKGFLKTFPVRTEKLIAFSGDLTEENFDRYVSETYKKTEGEDSFVVGLDYYEHMPVKVRMKELHSIAIYGKKGYGKTNLLRLMVRSIRKLHPDYRFVFFDDGRKQLEELYKENRTQGTYVTSIKDMLMFLHIEGYVPFFSQSKDIPEFTEKKTPPTVFIIQNKILFQSSGAQLMKNVFPKMIASAEEKGYWLIYSDVKKVSNNDRETESYLNNSIAAAFLLDNIAEFVSDRGSRSVFGEMDPKELKNEYARCEIGDGYFYDIESDELKKIKVIKT